MKDKFREISKMISKITLKVIKIKKNKEVRTRIFSNFDENYLSSKKTNVEKSTFCNMRFKGVH